MFITMATVYILYSNILDRYYIGYTNGDVIVRLEKHLMNHKGFTSKAKDWVVMHTEEFETSDGASNRERQIKAWKSRKKIERLVKGS